MNKLLRFLQRQQMPTSHQELYAKIHTLQETLERRDREHEDHLSDLRMERDRLFDELESISGWMDAMSESFEQDIPSVTKQTPWKGGKTGHQLLQPRVGASTGWTMACRSQV
jgi:chromosome segregation ATPase